MSEQHPNPAAESDLRERARRAELAVEQLRAELDTRTERNSFAGPEAQTLARLANTLQWDGAPRALRMVLPLARLLRHIARTPAPPSSAAAPAPAAQHRRSLKHRILVAGYRLTRPVALPLAIRLHRLLTKLLQREAMLAHADTTPSTTAATSDLLRSVEAAMLTLALQRRS